MKQSRKNALNNLANGGRGIGNIVESLFINPLSRYLFNNEIFENAVLMIDEIDDTAIPATRKGRNKSQSEL